MAKVTAKELDYTGDCDITRMVWNIEGAGSWTAMRVALVTDSECKVYYSDEDIRDVVMLMVEGDFQSFSCNELGTVHGGGSVSWKEFTDSWRSALEAQVRRGPGPRAEWIDEMMDQLVGDWATLEERLDCARTMYLAQTGETA